MITKLQAQKFLDDFKLGDILAITNLKREQSLKEHNSIILNRYLTALENLNYIIVDMEQDIIPYDVDFNDLYRQAMFLICNKCEKIIKEK